MEWDGTQDLYSSAVFDKLFPLAASFKVRLVTANRPDYPGATPLSDTERKQLDDITHTAKEDPESAAKALLEHIKQDSKKAYDFLVEFVSKESIPIEGGVIVAGWSFGAATILGLLANAKTFASKEVDLRSYIKHFVLYDAPSHLFGYQPPPNVYNPFFDPHLSAGEILKIFPRWVSGYHVHAEDLTTLGCGDTPAHPLPTILSMDPADLQRCVEGGPVLPGGADERVINLGVQLGVFARLKEAAIYLDTSKEEDLHPGNRWDSVKMTHVWCDRSPWEIPWGVVCLQAELDESKQAGSRKAREVDMCHWDQPKQALMGLLSGLYSRVPKVMVPQQIHTVSEHVTVRKKRVSHVHLSAKL
ncbi:hypothetical protein D9619_009903 [Psilocybe cf. subviscida]|uniref:Uncharacterized protein n=1 Tax=Psilocybe cf. subviscida TaxID=2480587 RepID=A0A8H5BMK1_9AGAR|nr:hypothetical protein D9619_009903 [Psilocybe cf. subviscida]